MFMKQKASEADNVRGNVATHALITWIPDVSLLTSAYLACRQKYPQRQTLNKKSDKNGTSLKIEAVNILHQCEMVQNAMKLGLNIST